MSYPPGPPGPHDADEPGPSDASRGGPPPPPGYGPGPQQGGPQMGYGGPGPRPTNAKATAALITGISTLVLSWCCGFGVLGAIAIVLGVKARSEIRDSQGTQEGDGIALAGMITGGIAILVGVLAIIVIIVAIATGQAAYNDYYAEFS